MIAGLILSLWLAAPATTEIPVVTLPPKGALSLMLAPPGKLELRRDNNATRIRIEIDRPIRPDSLNPVHNTFVVWAVSPEGFLENAGELTIIDGKARTETSTHYEQVGILITAEPHALVEAPSDAIAYKNQPPREPDVRRRNVSIVSGAMDYSALRPAPGGTGLIMQARAAFEIARLAGADKTAEPEFRAARIAIDTMEEGFSRATPIEILIQSTNEAIRRSHHAAVTARARAPILALESARREIAALNEDQRQLDGRLKQANEETAAANAQIRKLQTDLANERKTNEGLALEREQLQTRLRQSERRIEEITARQTESERAARADFRRSLAQVLESEDTENGTILIVPDGLFEPRRAALTASGRASLFRLAGLLRLGYPGNIQIDSYADGTEAASSRLAQDRADGVVLALTEAGIAPERLQARMAGVSKPLAANDTPDNRSRNRRVEITLRP